VHGNASFHTSPTWSVPAHTLFMGINSDAAGQTGPQIMGTLTTPTIDLSDYSSPLVSFEALFRNSDFYGNEVANVSISIDGDSTWNQLINLEGNGNAWTEIIVDISSYAGQVIQLSFFYDDDG